MPGATATATTTYPDVDDLRRCLEHNVPINRCGKCWPTFLTILGNMAWRAYQEGKKEKRQS